MIEREMEYRGSKSVFNNTVKEQRVDGSCCKQPLQLRCTLMGFERNYQVKILSKQNYEQKQVRNFHITRVVRNKLHNTKVNHP
jgi:hypothetical protein